MRCCCRLPHLRRWPGTAALLLLLAAAPPPLAMRCCCSAGAASSLKMDPLQLGEAGLRAPAIGCIRPHLTLLVAGRLRLHLALSSLAAAGHLALTSCFRGHFRIRCRLELPWPIVARRRLALMLAPPVAGPRPSAVRATSGGQRRQVMGWSCGEPVFWAPLPRTAPVSGF
ncbi:hypothetical protein C2845_PM02G22390 [Panicum miliaceum]|uniref:Secreted protein n=1 Tax=Panicum miliaceum TaxID=4540 RepID=A0A3L6S4Q5_PANMI|nr:hypothetical protein C2845_PM02G22390 [Panicum miliaceum]